MWFLSGAENAAGINVWIPPGVEITCGRTNCDVTIANDKSVSRKHAVFTVRRGGGSGSDEFAAYIQDGGSKFGVFINGSRIGGEANLRDGDEVQLGALRSKLRVCRKNVVICFSNVSSILQSELARLAGEMGVCTTGHWTGDCGVLVMEELRLTEKVIQALQYGKPIVSVAWVRALAGAANELRQKGTAALPDPKAFLPRINDEAIQSGMVFTPDPRRRSIFAGKTFVVFSIQQYERVRDLVAASGGTAVYCQLGDQVTRSAIAVAQFCGEFSTPCIIDPDEPGDADIVRRAAQRRVSQLSLDSVTENDISLAILYASVAVYCNPTKGKRDPPTISAATMRVDTADCSTTATRRQAGGVPEMASTCATQTYDCGSSASETQKVPSLETAFKLAREKPTRRTAQLSSFFEDMIDFPDPPQSSAKLGKNSSPTQASTTATSLSSVSNTQDDPPPVQTNQVDKVTREAPKYTARPRASTKIGKQVNKRMLDNDDGFAPDLAGPSHGDERTASVSSAERTQSDEKHYSEVYNATSVTDESFPGNVASLRQLVVVEVTSLIVAHRKQPLPSSSPQAMDSGGALPNFKRFRKNVNSRGEQASAIPLVEYRSGLGAGARDDWLTRSASDLRPSLGDCEDIFSQSDMQARRSGGRVTARNRRVR
ncbi:hypothetical protein THASP1DRAFT_32550 [Thamnocephalis sphaerospora]|uniref:FHA domain-containing protein n=1 Tax=Thamnocephalis sphaerospora TaxID=78915 RepID=A0A4P9XIR4_9FUNG|nr:hypothetical protein THASP1DRAFT_32550 [Thamnocephalis sphaerospora]|eukprot:RKP05613.1 hypothetical protein THASP1DRAFT_32550 [Thamnocephalis sphaerospora]